MKVAHRVAGRTGNLLIGATIAALIECRLIGRSRPFCSLWIYSDANRDNRVHSASGSHVETDHEVAAVRVRRVTAF